MIKNLKFEVFMLGKIVIENYKLELKLLSMFSFIVENFQKESVFNYQFHRFFITLTETFN